MSQANHNARRAIPAGHRRSEASRPRSCSPGLLSAIRPPGCGLVWLPQSFVGAPDPARPTGPDKQRVAQTVQVADAFRRHAFRAAYRTPDSLGARTDVTADVSACT